MTASLYARQLRACRDMGAGLDGFLSLCGWGGPVTHRQFEAVASWLDDEWNRPSRGDHYAMQTAMEVRLCRKAFAGGSGEVSLKDFKIPFGPAQDSPREAHQGKPGLPPDWDDEKEAEFQRQKAEMDRAAAAGALGLKDIVHRRISKAEYEEIQRRAAEEAGGA